MDNKENLKGAAVNLVMLDDAAFMPEPAAEPITISLNEESFKASIPDTDLFAVVQSAFITLKECINSDKKIKHKLRDINFVLKYNSELFKGFDASRTTPKQNEVPDLFDIIETGFIELSLIANGNDDKKSKQKKMNKICNFYASFFEDVNKKAENKITEASDKLDKILAEELPEHTEQPPIAKPKTKKAPSIPKTKVKAKVPTFKDTSRTKSRGRG